MTSVTGPLSPEERDTLVRVATQNAPHGFEAITDPNRFRNHIGPLFCKTGVTATKYGLYVDARHSNRSNVMHGGALLTFAHMSIEDALSRVYTKKPPHMISIQSQFVRSAEIGNWIECVPDVTHKTRDILFVKATVTTSGEINLAVTSLWSHAEREHTSQRDGA